MELAGIIVRAFPKDLEAIRSQLTSLTGVEVHHATPEGHLIVTIEQPTHQLLSAHLTTIQDIHMLLSLSMVYQYSDELNGSGDLPMETTNQSNTREIEHSNGQETSS